MIRLVPVILAVALSMSHIQFNNMNQNFNADNLKISDSTENKNPRNHLTQDNLKRTDVTAKVLSVGEARPKSPNDSTKNLTDENEELTAKNSSEIREEIILRLSWDIVPKAVKYKISYDDKNIMAYTSGVEIPVDGTDKVFRVTALDFDNNILDDDVKITEIVTNPSTIKTTSEFDKMSYPPIYLVYSWIPSCEADHYEIQLFKDGELLREFVTEFQPQDDNFDFYDTIPVIDKGVYYWRIRAMTKSNFPLTEWSEQNPGNTFKIYRPIRFCALGDSITHGGGSISVSPSMVMYNWENYCDLPVKNLGKSGDTTEQMLNRFDEDVLPFHPEVLFIMAGVNDFRSDIIGWYSVENLTAIKEKCEQHGIIPVFITPTPVNPKIINKVQFVEAPPYDWRSHQKYICDWIRQQKYYIDLTDEFTDFSGNLKESLTSDGLHPDAEGKQIIGEAVGKWIHKYLDSLEKN